VKSSCGTKPPGLTAGWQKAVRSRRSGVVLASTALLVVAGSGLISAYCASFAAAAGSTASGSPSPDPAPPPAPVTTSSSPPPVEKAASTPTTRKKRAVHKAKRRKPAVHPALKPFSHEPRDIPVYAAGTRSAGVQPATAAVDPASSQVALSPGAPLTYGLLLALVGISLLLLAIAATPARAVAVVSGRLAIWRIEIGLLGASILLGIGLAIALVLGLRALG